MTAAPNELLATLLDGKSPEDFAARALASKATYRAERRQPLAAAMLFELAADRALAEGAGFLPWIESYVRAGLQYFAAGDHARALPMLRRAIDEHARAGANRDDHMVFHALDALLADAHRRGDADAFRALFAEGRAIASTRGHGNFPWIHLHQEKALEAALALGLGDEARVVADAMWVRRPLSRVLRRRLTELGFAPR